MSSKSRKQSGQGGSRKSRPGAPTGGRPPGGSAQSGGVLDLPDDYLRVPRQTSRLRFVLMIGLVVVLLIIFIVPNAIYNWVGGSGEETVAFMKWTRSDGTVEEIDQDRFKMTRRRFASLFTNGGHVGGFLGEDLGVIEYIFSQKPDLTLTDEEVAWLTILDELSREQGIVITGSELLNQVAPLVDQLEGTQNYIRYIEDTAGSVRGFEQTLATAMRIQRYLLILGKAAALPDPTRIEEMWNEEHVETLYDYVEVELASLEDEVKAEAPDDEALQTWLDELDEVDRIRYEEPERRRVGLALFRDLEATPAAALIAAYPEPESETEEVTPDDLAELYFNRTFMNRFLRPEEPEDPEAPAEEEDPDAAAGDEDASEEDPADNEPELPDFLTFDEVKDRCLVEAPVYFAMDRWLRDMASRKAQGEEVDLATEAQAMGLAYDALEEPLSQLEFAEHEALGSGQVATYAFRALPDTTVSRIVAREDYFGLIRVEEVVAPVVPPVADIREEVLEDWVEAMCEERATARLAALRDACEELPPSEDDLAMARLTGETPETRRTAEADAFRTAVEAAGFEIRQRGWLDRAGLPDADSDRDLPAHQFIRSTVEPADTEVGEVSPVAANGAGDRVFLVRKADSREVPIERMTPGTYERYKDMSIRTAPRKFIESFDTAYLREQFGLWLAPDDYELPVEGDTTGDTEDA